MDGVMDVTIKKTKKQDKNYMVEDMNMEQVKNM